MDEQEYVNGRATAEMSLEAYITIVGILQAHVEEHPEDGKVLASISWTRTA